MKRVNNIVIFLFAYFISISGAALADGQKIFPLMVDGKKTFQSLIKDGHYTNVDEELVPINPKLAPSANNKINFVLVEWKADLALSEVTKELERLGYRPATLRELLAFGAQFPEEQLLPGKPILAPHAVLRGRADDEMEHTYFVYLRGVEKQRILGAAIAGSFWNKNWRCLAAQLTDAEKQGR